MKHYSLSCDRSQDIRSRYTDAVVAAKLQRLGIAYTYQAPITWTNFYGDTAVHTASFKLTASGIYLDVINRFYGNGQSLPADKSRAYTPRYDTAQDVTGAGAVGQSSVREASLLDSLARLFFQFQAESIADGPLYLIVPNPYHRVRGESGPMITAKRWLNGQVPGRDDGFAPVWTWSEKLQDSWLA